MKKDGILNNQLSRVIAEMGHKDRLVICDSGLPIPREVERVDLALQPGTPKFKEVLAAVLDDLVVEGAVVAEEMKEESPQLWDETKELLAQVGVKEITTCTHKKFKKLTTDTKGIVRSGEVIPFANIILISGVDF
ncbi:MAG: D-ribose pyranase [Bacillota bacterium]